MAPEEVAPGTSALEVSKLLSVAEVAMEEAHRRLGGDANEIWPIAGLFAGFNENFGGGGGGGGQAIGGALGGAGEGIGDEGRD